MPIPPSGTKSVSWLGSGAKPSTSSISSRVVPRVDCSGSSSPPLAAIHWKAMQAWPWATAALTSSMNQLPEPRAVSGFIWLTRTSMAFWPASSLMTPSIWPSPESHRFPPYTPLTVLYVTAAASEPLDWWKASPLTPGLSAWHCSATSIISSQVCGGSSPIRSLR